MSNFQYIFLRILLSVLTIAIALYVGYEKLYYTALFIGIVAVILLIELYEYIRQIMGVYNKTLLAISQHDFSADYSRYRNHKSYKTLFLVYQQLKETENQQVSQNQVFQSLLDNLETGILILQKESNDWKIFLMNTYFSNHFKVPKVSHWKYLKNQIPSFCDTIEQFEFKDVKTTLQIRVNNQENQTFVLQSSLTKTYSQEFCVLFLDSVQKLIDRKEKEAWLNLIKIISHELLNSLTPIQSLSQNLETIINQPELTPEDWQDITQSVQTIKHRGNHLQQFVESYRRLAMLPTPVKNKIPLEPILNNALQLMQPLFKKQNIRIQTIINHNNHYIYADKNQIEQVLINLLTNSLYALEETENKHISLTTQFQNNRTFITITDTGNGIEKAIENKIFMPFFTTRANGAGIGLTLSKNIIEAHGGYLIHQSNEVETSFTICLIQ